MLKRTTWRAIAAVLILAITIVAFVDYFATHPAVLTSLRDTSPGLLVSLLGLYIVFIGSLALIIHATLRLCGARLGKCESLLLTMYSSVINFFGPLQSGPAFRGLYLKQKYGVKLKNYGSATLVYYGFYALISGLFLVSGVLGWWLIPLAVFSVALIYRLAKGQSGLARRFQQLDLGNWYYLAIATLVQSVIQVIIYYLELHSLTPGVGLGQVIVYTGAANLALFVALTPGAIGFRESFLVFSQNLHHISNGTIVVANTIDRAMYISVLLIAAVFIFGTHAQNQLKSYTKGET